MDLFGLSRLFNHQNELLTRRRSAPAIPESHDVLCENCHHHVSISGFIPHLSGAFNECPHCGCTDPTKLKYVAAWMRTEEEQRAHWEGRKVKVHRGKVTAINDGQPLRQTNKPKTEPLPKRTVVLGGGDAA